MQLEVTFVGSSLSDIREQIEEFLSDEPVVQSVQIEQPSLDIAGFPWDKRIHSSTKGMNADGTWRKRRGILETTVQSVEKELLGRVPAVPTPAEAVSVPAVPTPAEAVSVPAVPTPVEAASVPAVPTPVEAASVPAVPTPVEAASVPAVPTPAEAVSVPTVPTPAEAVSVPTVPTPQGAQIVHTDIVNLISSKKLDVPLKVLPVIVKYGMTGFADIFKPEYQGLLSTIYQELAVL